MDLTEFLLARIAEDEHKARAEIADGLDVYEAGWSASRVVSECGARRRVVEEWQAAVGNADEVYASGLESACLLLAVPYASHPDYRDEWRPPDQQGHECVGPRCIGCQQDPAAREWCES